MIQLEDVCGNIGHACYTSAEQNLDSKMTNKFSLTTTSLKIICVNDNNNDIKRRCLGLVGK